MKKIDLPTGTKIGQIEIIGFSHKQGKHHIYKYQCLCGKIGFREKHDLLKCKKQNNDIKCKTCSNTALGEKSHSYQGIGDLSGSYFNRIKDRAKKKHRDFNITIEYIWNLFLKQEKKCAISGKELTLTSSYGNKYDEQNASLDRIDSSKGYIEGNVWWVDKDINKLKLNHSLEKFIDICKNVFINQLHKNQLNWIEYHILLAQIISTRSKDPSTHCGCVITDKDYRIISCGYNGSLQNIDDSLVPKTRPEKYKYILHAEENSCIFAKRDLTNCIAFITGRPCSTCTRMMIQAGIRKIYYGSQKINMIDESEIKATDFLCKSSNTELILVDN